MKNSFEKQALRYHSEGKPGKVDVRSSKKCDTEYDLSLAYSPGVAAPCIEIYKDPSKANLYTTKGNLVAVISDGSAVLGLGNIGPLASKPVMEGKGVLFKQFANIDVFDIEIKADTTEEFINAVKALEPTFGGINLEDIAAPKCFEIEKRLKEEMNIPVFHDDQHGTAIISGAALINACLLTKRKLKNIKVVFNGAGAAAVSCARIMIKLGVTPKNIIMCDSKGVIYKGRTDGMNEYKAEFAVETKARTLAEALKGADVFCGLSVAGVLTGDMLKSMAKKPIVFAMANPDPEITPEEAKKFRDDVIIATGRSDYPNQVNNVLGFPSIFRGALDVEATHINEEMKIAAVHALAELAREDVPDSVSSAYGDRQFSFGEDYIIPKPFDPRVIVTVAPAVAKAAMETGVAKKPIEDFDKYKEDLESMDSYKRGFIRSRINQIKSHAKKHKEKVPMMVFPEGRSTKILKAINSIANEGIIRPVLLGYEEHIKDTIKKLELDHLDDVPIFQPSKHPKFNDYCAKLFEQRQRKGVTYAEAERLMADPYYFAAMMVEMNDADGLISGSTQNYANCVRPILKIIGVEQDNVPSGLNIVIINNKILFFTDTTVNINPSAEQIAKIALNAAKVARSFNIKPKVAMLSFSNFTAQSESPKKMKQAADILKSMDSSLMVDGEMQADTAVNPEIMERLFPFSDIKGGANILVFPNLDAGNIAYKLVQQLGGGEVIGPFLLGVNKPANVLQRTCSVEDIISNIVIQAQQTQVNHQ